MLEGVRYRLVLGVIIGAITRVVTSAQVTFYEQEIWLGDRLTVNFGREDCYNLPERWDNEAISLQTRDNCIFAFDWKNCRGEGTRFANDTLLRNQDMSIVDLDKKVTSFRACAARGRDAEVIEERENVTIYGVSDFEGIAHTVEYDTFGCVNLPWTLQKEASSVNTHENCIVAYDKLNCRGARLLLDVGSRFHNDLAKLSYDNRITSFQSCASDLLPSTTPGGAETEGVVTFFSRAGFEGDIHTEDFKASQCVNLPRSFSERASSVSTYGSCIVAYADQNYRGSNIVLDDHSPHHEDLNKLSFDDKITSFQSCTGVPILPTLPPTMEPEVEAPPRVTFFSLAHFQGDIFTLTYDEFGCFDIPSHFWEPSSVSTHGQCILVYEKLSCGGKSIRLHVNNQIVENLENLSFEDKISSFRACVSNSPTTTKRPRPTRPPSTTGTPISDNRVIFYEGDNFTGKYFTYYYLRNTCYDLPSLWRHRASSVVTHHRCIRLFDQPNCTGKSRQIDPGVMGHRQLADATLDNAVSSFQPCSPNNNKNINNNNNNNNNDDLDDPNFF